MCAPVRRLRELANEGCRHTLSERARRSADRRHHELCGDADQLHNAGEHGKADLDVNVVNFHLLNFHLLNFNIYTTDESGRCRRNPGSDPAAPRSDRQHNGRSPWRQCWLLCAADS